MAKENRLVILKTANKLFRQGKIDLAIKEYNKILGIKPNDLEVRRIIGDLQLKQNNISGAVDQFEWIADYFLKEGFFAKAIAMYKRITRINPNYEGASVKLAELYTKQGLIIEAKQIYLDLAEENKRKNNYKKSLDMYKKILEFDRNNIKMRLLLADNYYREGLKDNAISEYLTAADILIHKKEFQKAEELLLSTSKKVQNVQVMEKLIRCYTNRGDDQKAIELLRGLGSDLFKDINLLKLLGELYFKSDQIDEAEKIYKKITEISSEETEIIMKLGRVYLHRNEYEKAYGLFLPIVDKSLKEKKYEDAAALLRFIIASNNSYIPALKKLASIFKISDKKNNLIALYESLIPVYEQKEMKKELIEILEELIELSDAPFTYQEQLARLTGKGVGAIPDEESENEREKELINFNLRVVQEAINESDYEKAIDILQKTAAKFPDKIDIRLKLFDVYQLSNDNDSLMDEGIELLRLYKLSDDQDEFKKLLEKLYTLKPDDVRLAEYAGEEKTSIDIIFDKEELKDNMNEISDPTMKEIGIPEDIEDPKDILVLSEEESMPGKDKEYLAEQEAPRSNENRDSGGQIEDSKSLSSVFTELDFYINDGYFGDAERLIEQLREKYPKSQGLISRIERLKEVRFNGVKESTDSGEDLFDIKSSLAEESQMVQEDEDSKNIIKDNKLDQQEVVKVTENEYSDIDDLSFEIEMEEPENTDNIPIVEIDKDLIIQSPSVETKEGESNEGFLSSSEDLFELKEDD
ncbi:MAG: tetratricopeptide repeat protein, partial [Candidatus Aminicenantes bacterium]|nr:tetratricopeptide repeat protein [Candidatus Aminicenantes bacterium]